MIRGSLVDLACPETPDTPEDSGPASVCEPIPERNVLRYYVFNHLVDGINGDAADILKAVRALVAERYRNKPAGDQALTGLSIAVS